MSATVHVSLSWIEDIRKRLSQIVHDIHGVEMMTTNLQASDILLNNINSINQILNSLNKVVTQPERYA
jgi:hypothetical protein